ncbi:MAG: TRAP transporter large permease [Spirochaetales bacterium]
MSLPLLVFILAFVAIFIFRIPISLGMIAASTFYVWAKGLDLGMVAEKILSNLYAKDILLAVPLFIFTANVMNTSKVTNLIFEFANTLVGRWRGGMGHVNVLASLIFSGMTGSAVADASGLGVMEIQAMREAGYDDDFSCAITAASATIGPIFPPSIPMVFYAMLSSTSIGSLFMAGMTPGVIMALALMLYIAFIAGKRKYPYGPKYTRRQFLLNTFRAIPALLTPVILLIGIYTGIVTPTEAGALAAFYGIVISVLVYRSLGWKDMWKVLVDTVKATGNLSLIVGAAYAVSYVVAVEQIADMVSAIILSITENKYILLFVINLLFFILGMFIDTSTITLVFIPMVLPLAERLGIDFVHLGVVIVLNMMIGLLTPPFGVLLFITSGISGTPLRGIIREVWPMIAVLVAVLILITYVPEVALWVPHTFFN